MLPLQPRAHHFPSSALWAWLPGRRHSRELEQPVDARYFPKLFTQGFKVEKDNEGRVQAVSAVPDSGSAPAKVKEDTAPNTHIKCGATLAHISAHNWLQAMTGLQALIQAKCMAVKKKKKNKHLDFCKKQSALQTHIATSQKFGCDRNALIAFSLTAKATEPLGIIILRLIQQRVRRFPMIWSFF